MWYVVQAESGREARVKQLIEKMVDRTSFKECFIPKKETMRKVNGVWRKYRETLIPGYIFIVSDNVEQLYLALKDVPTFTKLLGNNEKFIPLDEDEVSIMSAFLGTNERVMEMSEGVIEGDRVIIAQGPLMEYSGLIKKIDRHKRVAFLDVELFGRTITIKAGLEIIKRR